MAAHPGMDPPGERSPMPAAEPGERSPAGSLDRQAMTSCEME
jgi:hypothetical protein